MICEPEIETVRDLYPRDVYEQIRFTVVGIPATAGSKRGFTYKKPDGSYGVRMTHDNKRAEPWMAAVAAAAREAYSGELLRGPLQVWMTFNFPHPKGHFRTGRNADQLRDSAPQRPITKPDTTKLVRAVEDALTGVLWKDDSQVVILSAGKQFHTHGCCVVRVQPLR